MSPLRISVTLSGWLMIGFIANYIGVITPEVNSLWWWLLMGIPGALIVTILFGGFIVSVSMLFIALLAPAARQ
jgi:hypothetical protein